MEGSRLADNKYFRYYFYFVLGEIFLMGSGENLPIVGYFTVRIFNYMVGLLVSFYLFLRGDDFPKVILGFMLGFIVTTIVSYMMAVIQDSDPEYLMADMKQLCYFLILLYFYYAVSNALMMKRLVDILLICVGIFLSYKFTDNEDYIADEIRRSAKATLVLELIPEHMTGKLVNEK